MRIFSRTVHLYLCLLLPITVLGFTLIVAEAVLNYQSPFILLTEDAKVRPKSSTLVCARMLDVAAQKYSTPDHLITASDLAARIQIGGTVRGYGQYMSPEERLEQDEKQFSYAVDQFADGKLKEKTVRVMTTPLVMKLVGADILPVEISAENMKKILEGKHKDGVSANVIKQIPRALADPLFIARSYGGRKVAAVDLKDETGAGVIVIFELGKENGNYTVNDIRSIYGKTEKKTNVPDWKWLTDQFTKYHTVEYINKRKTINWIHNEKLETLLPYESSDGFFNSIKADEDDLVKLKQENPSYYQMAGEHAETAPLAKLEEAKAMQASGEDENAIWKKTGWMVGKDGKWRWEIPDNLDGIDVSAVRSMKEGDATVLGRIYDNDELYEAYPWLKYIEVHSGDIGQETHYGYTERRRRAHLNRITLNANLMRNEDQVEQTLIHGIQYSIKDMAEGSGDHCPVQPGSNLRAAHVRCELAREKVNSKKMTDPHGVGIHGRTAPPYHQRTSSDRRGAGRRYWRTYQRSVRRAAVCMEERGICRAIPRECSTGESPWKYRKL